MAKVGNPKHIERVLTEALTTGLRKAGINAKVSSEPVPQTKLRRFMVIAPKFRAMRPSERQNLAWRIAGQVLTQDEQLLVSMILTLTRDELAGK
ncbi:MAG: hypothetical protein NTX50_30885 [Candidatus Sumerlaeota bacterium]|nr:hypothetical protein [Candidatus Sumerlaeota bacterium]